MPQRLQMPRPQGWWRAAGFGCASDGVLPAALALTCAAHADSQSPSVELRDAATICRRQLEPGASTPW
jgi:hypothetical protein